MNKHYNQGEPADVSNMPCSNSKAFLVMPCRKTIEKQDVVVSVFHNRSKYLNDDAGHVSGCENNLICIHRQNPGALRPPGTCPFFQGSFFI